MEKYLKYLEVFLRFVPDKYVDELVYNFIVKMCELVESSDNTLDDKLLLPILKKLKAGFTSK